MIDEEWNFHSKLDYYLAQVAFLIDLIPARIWGDKEYKSDLDSFLIKFKTGDAVKPPPTGDVSRRPPRTRKKDKFAGVSDADLARYGTKFDPKDMTPDERKECEASKRLFFSAVLLDPEGKPSPEFHDEMAKRKAAGLHTPAASNPASRPRNNPVVRKETKDGH